jgi:imidazolonepropionase-like amidohydrolase
MVVERSGVAIVIRGGTLLDGTGRDPVPGSAVVVEGDSITAVGRESEVSSPSDARILDAEGKTVLPGFIDCHAHLIAYKYELEKRLTTPASLTVLETARNLQATLEAGVTTVRDAGGVDAGIKMAVEEGVIPGPRLLVSIVILAQTGALWDLYMGSGAKLDTTGMTGRLYHYCGGVENLRQLVRELVHAGADVIDISTTGNIHAESGRTPVPRFTLEEIETVVYEAHAAGRRVMVHLDGGPGVGNAIRAGVDSIDHPFYLSDGDISLMLDRGTFLVPTFACNYSIVKVAEADPTAGIHEEAVEGARRVMADHVDGFRRAAEAGVKIAMGSDSFGRFQGENLVELELMVRAGFSPMQAIVAGTGSAAECLAIEDRLGTLAVGKAADILVVDGDPLADIEVLQDRENLALIMKEGKIFKSLLAA